jgi:hypothetical protein
MTERRARKKAPIPRASAPSRQRSGTAASAPAGRKKDLRDDAGDERRRDRADPRENLGALVEAARQEDRENPPNLARQKTESDHQEIGPQAGLKGVGAHAAPR